MSTELPPSIAEGLHQHFTAFARQSEQDGGRLGFKIAFNPPAVQKQLGIPFSLAAGLPKARMHPGGDHSLQGGTDVALEAEVAVQLGQPVAANATEADAAAAIAALMPAVEIVDRNRPIDQISRILEEGVFQRSVVFGQAGAAPAGGRLDGIEATITHNGETLATVDAGEATGDAPKLLLHVARLVEPYGVHLQAGDRIILGSMAMPAKAQPGDHFGLTLAGIGSVEVNLTE